MPEPGKTDPRQRSTTLEPQLDLVRAEYVEANSYHRHYSNLRFAILPIYFAVVGALGAVATGVAVTHTKVFVTPGKTLDLPRCAAVGAALVTILFFTFERRCEQLLDYFETRQINLESVLGYKTVTERPKGRTLIWQSTQLFYIVSLLAWIFITIWGR